MFAYDQSEWSDLFVASAGASAALAGLVVVAISINIDRILKFPGLPERALVTLLMLLGVVVVSTLGLAPGQSRTALGLELLGASLVGAIGIAILLARGVPATSGPLSWRLGHASIAVFATLPFVLGGASVLAGVGGGLYWILAGIVFAIVGAVLNAWVLLVEILR